MKKAAAVLLAIIFASCTSTLDKLDNLIGTKMEASRAEDWDTETLDTARDASYLSQAEKAVIYEMNKVRANPAKYAEKYIPAEEKECFDALTKAEAAPILKPEKGLYLAAKEHTDDQSVSGKTGHEGGDGSTPFTRMKKYGGGYTTAGENIAYGDEAARDIIVNLLIDKDVPSRGHRVNIMNKRFNQTAVSIAKHPEYGFMCVIDYAAGYTSND